MLGAVVSSSSPAVAARCAWARAGTGAACTQNVTHPTLGPALLDRLAGGDSADDALAAVTAGAAHVDFRQLSVVDTAGRSAVFSGAQTLGLHATRTAPGCAAAGNLLADAGVPAAMADAFLREPDSHLGDRLLAALCAGRDAGGEEGPVRSAGVLVVDAVPWPVTDLRVDWTDGDPVEELRRLWRLWRPQAEDYVTRALDPRSAPRYGVPGDE
jgi:uncharacterized Ntn-hydrolase superfamily protein